MIQVHRLEGCAPTPLAHYLKALGVLRLIGEDEVHGDPQARGWWDGDGFRLATTLTSEQLAEYFLLRYQPTALVAPWNRGSGFYYANDPGLTALESSVADRFAAVREGIESAREPLDAIAEADRVVRSIKDETKVTPEDRQQLRIRLGFPTDKKAKLTAPQKKALKDEESALRKIRKTRGNSDEYKKRLSEAERHFKRLKAELIPCLRQQWRGGHQDWMTAALVLDGDGAARWPALLGTGGADGKLDFTNNFFQRLADVFDLGSPEGAPQLQAETWLSGALWSRPILGLQAGSAVGQYLPSAVGGANSGNGPSGESFINPFDFILMMEGTLLFSAHATKRLGTSEQIRAAAPFAVLSQGAGYASASDSDESPRGEQWMPLWSRPLSLREVKRLFSEGRAQLTAKPVREPLDLACAVARLGTARGIHAFQRFGYIERNGQSNLAVPLGRFEVPAQSTNTLDCLDDLSGWLSRLRREARSQHTPARFRQAERQLGNALFAVTQHPTEPSRWQRVLLALGEIEAIQASGTGFKPGPIPRLRPAWVLAADDGEAPLRLAVALALQHGGFRGSEARWWNSVRRHWLPLDRRNLGRFAQTGDIAHARLLPGPEVVMHGRRGAADAIALVSRRLIESAQHGQRSLTLIATPRASATSADLASLVFGSVDLDRTLALARVLMAIDPSAWSRERPTLSRPEPQELPDDAWLLLRLALHPRPIRIAGVSLAIRNDPAIFRRLVSGDAATAVELALRRLRSVGIRTAVRATSIPESTARL